MKALGILGTSSNSGKSWVTTALCALLRRRGVRVAPFKAQNMSNNSFVTLDGGEIGRAQSAQAEAAGLIPTVEMNPILLKPSGLLGSQLILRGNACEHIKAADYYRRVDELWGLVRDCLDGWRDRCDVLLMEGAGSPVELNLMHRDIVNLKPVEYLDGRWLLVSNIERGGVFAQIVGTWNLIPPDMQPRGLGVIVNQFRGDLSLFADAASHLVQHTPLPYLGVLPHRANLQPESEDSLCHAAEVGGDGDTIAWVRFPHLSNSQDIQPWLLDQGVRVTWVHEPAQIAGASAIILPGSKDTLVDLAWLERTGLADRIRSAAASGTPIVGICGGYQMLGRTLADPAGVAGSRGIVPGLNLLPVETAFHPEKTVTQVTAHWEKSEWQAYEIHMGQTRPASTEPAAIAPLLQVTRTAGAPPNPEGCRASNIWGTYLHGLFESPAVRTALATAANFRTYHPSQTSWKAHTQSLYTAMADLLEAHLDLRPVWQYLQF